MLSRWILSALALVSPSHPAPHRGSARVAGSYRLHVPASVPNGTPMPLVVAFHGAGASALQTERGSGLSALADRAGFVVVYPEGRGRAWAGNDADVRLVRAVIDEVSSKVAIDPRRVYATGISSGAVMAARAVCALPETFAALATVSAAFAPATTCMPSRPVPVLAFHGRADRVVPLAGRSGARPLVPAGAWAAAWAARNGCLTEPLIATRTPGVETLMWGGCAGDARVVLEVVDSLGHAWPGDPTDARSASPIDATAEIWDFFAAVRR